MAQQGIALDTGKYLSLLPHIHGTDGFFAAVFEKKVDPENVKEKTVKLKSVKSKSNKGKPARTEESIKAEDVKAILGSKAEEGKS